MGKVLDLHLQLEALQLVVAPAKRISICGDVSSKGGC